MKYTTFNSVEIVCSVNSNNVFHQNVVCIVFMQSFYAILYNLETFTFCSYLKIYKERFRNVHYISLKYSMMFTVT